MSEQESNVCTVCGGILQIEYVIGFRQCVPHEMRIVNKEEVVGDGPLRMCPGHPAEPEQRHDGNLDEQGSRVWHDPSWGYDCVRIALHDGEQCSIRPKQALSLRDWLIQESLELERLAAKEEVKS